MSREAEVIENKVAKSGLITLDLQEWYDESEVVPFDLKDYLHMELVLKEKEFRGALAQHDWQQYEGKTLAVYCSSDAIIASWAYMLVAAYASKHAGNIIYGTPESAAFERFRKKMESVNWSEYEGKRVLLKGGSDVAIPPSAYLYATQKLLPYVDRLMYGEACSFVPVYRASRGGP